MDVAQYCALDARGIVEGIRARRWSVREVVEAAFARCDEVNSRINAFTVFRREEALAEADRVDASLGGGEDREIGPLCGVPIAVKEEYDVAGLPTTLGGFGNVTPAERDSEAIRRVRHAGAIIIGKTTMPEFGQFTDTESERYGVTRNPLDERLSPGGSSGGSAAAVAAGIVPVALAADGGGSIRIPAACCGIVGLKPARGRISPAPLREHWHGLVTLGAVTRSVADAALLHDVLSGSVPGDRFVAEPLGEPLLSAVGAGGRRLRVGVSYRSVLPGVGVDSQVRAAVVAAADRLRRAGHDVREDSRVWPLPTVPFFVHFLSGMAVEAASVEDASALERRTRVTAGFGRCVPGVAVRWAVRAADRVARIIDDRFFAHADVVMLATMPVVVPRSGVVSGKGTVRSLLATSPMVANTAIFNVSGHPAISVPSTEVVGGVPVGVQLVSRVGDERYLIRLAQELLM